MIISMNPSVPVATLCLALLLVTGCQSGSSTPNTNTNMTEPTSKKSDSVNENKKMEKILVENKNDHSQCLTTFETARKINLGTYEASTLTKEKWNNALKTLGIAEVCIPQSFGTPTEVIDWDYTKEGRGRMTTFGFSGLLNQKSGGWGRSYLVYSTYDFQGETEYDTFGKKEDYQTVAQKTLSDVIVQGAKGFERVEAPKRMDYVSPRKVVLFPFKNYYLAFVYELPIMQEGDEKQVKPLLENLAKKNYPLKWKDDLEQFDALVQSIKFFVEQ